MLQRKPPYELHCKKKIIMPINLVEAKEQHLLFAFKLANDKETIKKAVNFLLNASSIATTIYI